MGLFVFGKGFDTNFDSRLNSTNIQSSMKNHQQSIAKEGRFVNERHHPRGRRRHTLVPPYHGHIQATPARL